MKFLLVLSCALACAVAKPGIVAPAGVLAYSNIVPAAAGAIALGESPISYAAHASTAPIAVAAGPAAISYSAPAISYSAPAISYSAPAIAAYSAPAIAAAPAVAYSAHAVAAPAIAAAPAVAYSAPAVAAAPAVVASAPAVAYSAPAVVAAAPAVGLKTQYHAQDELGQAAYGHAEPLQAHSAVQDAHGNKIGAYSYVAPNGQVIAAKYVADALGYRVASNALPVGPGVGPAPVADTPEVVAARAAHLAEVAAARSRVRRGAIAVGHVPASTAPLAVAAHAPIAYSSPAVVAAHAPIAYSSPAVVAAPSAISYSALAAAPALAYSAPAIIPAHAPVAYAAAPVAVAAAAPSVRAATLTTVVNNPGHAVSYRVD